MQGLLAQANPQLGRILDQEARQKAQQARMQGANYGNDAMGRFLSAYSGAARSATEGGRELGNAVMGNEPAMGRYEQMAVQAQDAKLAEERKMQALQQKLSTASPEQLERIYKENLLTNPKLSQAAESLMDRMPEKPKDITSTVQAINASDISREQKASLIRLTASGNISSSEALDSISDIAKEARESAGKWKSTGGDGSTMINDVTGERRTFEQVNKGRDTSLTQDKIAELYKRYTPESIAKFIDDPKAPLINLSENKKDTFDYDEANTVATELTRKSTSLSNLAYRLGESNLVGGARGQFMEVIKQVTGTQDIETEIRKEYDLVVKSGMLKYLPPGVASDKDVALVLQGLPDTFTDGETARRYIMGMAKLQRQQAKYQQDRISYAKDNSGDMSGFLDGQKNKAMQEYRGSFDQLAVADPNVQKAYDNAKYLLSMGVDPVEVEQTTFGLFSNYPDSGFRNATLVNELIKLEGY